MTATDELRKLLDERGVEYYLLDESIVRLTMWQTCYEGLRHECQFDERHGESKLEIWDCTPEQAIAATLGNEACEWQGSVGQGWCQGAYDETVDEYDGFFTTWHILGCGHGVLMADDEKPSYCPNCGAKVVEQ